MNDNPHNPDVSSSESLVLAQPCPIRDVLDRIGDQWSLLVLLTLRPGTRRFNQLRREIDDISKQMLSRTLKQLEQDGLVSRTAYPEVPPRVEYQLTELGQSLLTPVAALVAWAEQHQPAVNAARERYKHTTAR
ncbi:transcriptional regulator [Salinicola endophyticus]|uniref:Transcriptional regulator n=1 Tax=Salinicola endophyticus TaxID=1949083 RepID=A0ABY8FGZ4_9GAMM|nr:MULTISPECIES: helix-turn-helix domain-containing protein [Salinicola]WFF42088.1 transcriptional regulator [Salinicola endophyticus]